MPTLPRALAAFLCIASLHALAAAEIQVESSSAQASRLVVAGKQIPLAQGGGFSVTDFAAKKTSVLEDSKVTAVGSATTYSAKSGDYSITATFTPTGDAIEVSGEITSRRKQDSAVVVSYALPLPAEGAQIEEDFGSTHSLPTASQILGTVYPVIAETAPNWGVSLSIPPDAAVCYGMTGSNGGLGVEFYLGLSPDQKASPNRAAFRFTIGKADTGWGFRSALAEYEARYPEYYRPPFVAQGLWLWSERGAIEPALPMYQTHSITHTKDFDAHLARDKQAGILTFDYVIVGQREIRKLPALPSDDTSAMKEFADFSAAWKSEAPDGPLHKMYANWRDQDLPDQIERSALGRADGQLRTRIRQTVWAGNSVTFIMNPSPYLFADRNEPTVGSMTLAKVKEWIAQEPRLDGIHVDSLGAQWPSWLNYRKDHEAYARYPLTFSPEGRVAVHNHLSHCEFLDELRTLLHANHKLMLGNGLYRYARGEGSETMEENYNAAESSRFFEAARLDASVREFEALPPRKDLEFFRACMGQKYYGGILYNWSDPEFVRRFMNRALVFTLFAGPHRNGNQNGGSYLESPEGYPRDRALLEWFLKNARALSSAGWQAVTHATVDQTDVACERYGSGDAVYLALNNFADKALETELTIDLGALGLDPRAITVSHSAQLNPAVAPVKIEGNVARLTLHLDPDTAHIIKIERTK